MNWKSQLLWRYIWNSGLGETHLKKLIADDNSI